MQIFCENCGTELKVVTKAFKVRRLRKGEHNTKLVTCMNCGRKNFVPVLMRITERY